jgi:shikimate 5-dehydrogenase
MDGITEPVILILGHPIGGNPAQFAFERALAAMNLEFRVISSDVAPERLGEAINGADVLGFRGMLLDRNLSDIESDRKFEDCFFRQQDDEFGWCTENALTGYLSTAIRDHFSGLDREIETLLSIGHPDPRVPKELASEQESTPIAWAPASSIEHADVIVVTESVKIDEWPRCENQSMVIDLAMEPNDVRGMRGLGYHVIGAEEARLGMLAHCLQRWTGKEPPRDVLAEAVEEYLAV